MIPGRLPRVEDPLSDKQARGSVRRSVTDRSPRPVFPRPALVDGAAAVSEPHRFPARRWANLWEESMPNRTMRSIRMLSALLLGAFLAGCSSFGPSALQQSRLQYNEVVKTTTEQQLLLNIVRLRYTDTPSSLAVSAIAAQFEISKNFQLTPFFVASGAEIARSYSAVLPQLGIGGADRPTFSLTPLDDQDFTRKLFTTLPLDGLVFLAKTTWPISTVFRLYLENLNWTSNAETASGPTPKVQPVFEDFLRGVMALQTLQDRGQIAFGVEERQEAQGGPLPMGSVAGRDIVEAAKSGYEYRFDDKASAWTLFKKVPQPVLLVDPQAVNSPEMQEVVRAFKLRQ